MDSRGFSVAEKEADLPVALPAPAGDTLVATARMAEGNAQSGCVMESIRHVIKTRKQEITACYHEAALVNPSIGGRIALQLGIDSSGMLVNRSVLESELPEEVAACILKSLRNLQFPGRFDRPCGIVYPFVFSATPAHPSR